jgi:hypothetical protein
MKIGKIGTKMKNLNKIRIIAHQKKTIEISTLFQPDFQEP